MNIRIIEFCEEYSKYFTELNIAWLQKYFEVEPVDYEMLSELKKFILDKDGFIFFAKAGNEIAGTFALIKIDNGVYELCKMAVAEAFQGKKIGNKMLGFCISEMKKLKAHKIILYSNTNLRPAIHLYKKYGFKEVPLEHADYKRADIKMEINLKNVS
jgi:ribosomal protein S18 acetylase RimI-like enzyme